MFPFHLKRCLPADVHVLRSGPAPSPVVVLWSLEVTKALVGLVQLLLPNLLRPPVPVAEALPRWLPQLLLPL